MELGIGSRVEHPSFGRGVIVETSNEHYEIWFKNTDATKTLAKNYDGLRVLQAEEVVEKGMQVVDFGDLELAINRVLDKRSDIQDVVQIGTRWAGGKMILQPADKANASKDFPIETLWHKIVMLRDRLRVLEANINAHKVLTDGEKVDLQQYITRCYGSLTTFNVLFKNEFEQFKGSGS
jgi:hypothetical protein